MLWSLFRGWLRPWRLPRDFLFLRAIANSRPSSLRKVSSNWCVRALVECLEERVVLTVSAGIPALTASSSSGSVAALQAGVVNSETSALAPSDATTVKFDSASFPDTIRVGQLGVPISVDVSNVTPGTVLDAWIDWNGDGNLGGASEHVATSILAQEGVNVLIVDVPSWAAPGTTEARFRLNSLAGPGGGQGLVVHADLDCQFTMSPPIYPSGQFGVAIPITTTGSISFTAAADMDRDVDLDLLSASFNGDDTIAWYENDGHENFTRHIIATHATQATCVIAADVNGDGFLDVVASSLGNNTITWYQNDGHQNFTPHVITTSAKEVSSVFVADVDGDGDLDLISASKGDGTVAWYENNGSQSFTWHNITTSANVPCSVFAADIDGDGDLDIVYAGFWDNTIAWFENDGHQGFTKNIITTTADGARGMYVADIDGDGHPDVVCASFYDNTIAWYQNDGHGGFVKHVITAAAKNAVAVFVADMDGDGDMDILASSRGNSTIAWFENTGGQSWPQHTITTTDVETYGVIAADVNGDGRLDVVSASKFGNQLAWYENLPEPSPLKVALGSSSPAVTSQTSIPVTVTFNESVTSFTSASLVVQNGTITHFQGHGASYAFDLIPGSEAPVTVTLPAGVVTDLTGHGNTAATLTREFDVVTEISSLIVGAMSFVRKWAPLNVAPGLTVTGSRVGGGTLQVVVNSLQKARLLNYVLDDTSLNVLGTVNRKQDGAKRVTTVTLDAITTAGEIQSALREMTFGASKNGANINYQVNIKLSDNAAQSGSVVQTIHVQRKIARIR
ncbi:MAG: hypothetical protein JWM11_3078 [Planctomycetaceae bacterium]|nr:hypothetical protein [Planctomycetaceae bacterium]